MGEQATRSMIRGTKPLGALFESYFDHSFQWFLRTSIIVPALKIKERAVGLDPVENKFVRTRL